MVSPSQRPALVEAWWTLPDWVNERTPEWPLYQAYHILSHSLSFSLVVNSPTWGFLTFVSSGILWEREVEIFLESFLHKTLYKTSALHSFKTCKDQHYLSWFLEPGCCCFDSHVTQTLGHLGPQSYSDYVSFIELVFQGGFSSKEVSVLASTAFWFAVAE